MKKKIIIILAIIVVLTLAMAAYKILAGNSISEKTDSYLEDVGYLQSDIEYIEIKHSLVNRFLGYNEWRIFVEFKKEPGIIFAFTYRDNQIIPQGIAGRNTQLSKEEIYEFDRKFNSGELKNQ